MIWFRRTQGLDTQTMRDIADSAGVSWDYQSIAYQSRGIGYVDGNPEDVPKIQDAAESLLQYRPVQIDPPDTNQE